MILACSTKFGRGSDRGDGTRSGWWVEPDVNIPCGESLIRQGLYGQRTLQRLFGRVAVTGYNPDSFGHTGSLPQILKLQRMSAYVFMRQSQTEKPSITQNLFWWQGIDGTETESLGT